MKKIIILLLVIIQTISYGKLRIRKYPYDALLKIDNKIVEKDYLEIADGIYDYEMSANNHIPKKGKIKIDNNKKAYSFILERKEKYQLFLDSNPKEVEVYHEGKLLGLTEKYYEFYEGDIVLKFKKDGYYDFSKTYKVDKNIKKQLITLLKKDIKLYLDLFPKDAKIYLNSKEIKSGTEVAAGDYILKVEKEGYISYEDNIKILDSMDLHKKIELKKDHGALSVSSKYKEGFVELINEDFHIVKKINDEQFYAGIPTGDYNVYFHGLGDYSKKFNISIKKETTSDYSLDSFGKIHDGNLMVDEKTDLGYLKSLTRIKGNLLIKDTAKVASFDNLTRIDGVININNNMILSRVIFPNLISVGTNKSGNSIRVSDSPLLKELLFPKLLKSDGAIFISNNKRLKRVEFPRITWIGSNKSGWSFDIQKIDNLTRLNFPLLESMDGSFDLYENKNLDIINLPRLTKIGKNIIGSSLELEKLFSLKEFNVPKLIEISGSVYLFKNLELKEFVMPNLEKIGLKRDGWSIAIYNNGFTEVIFDKIKEIEGKIDFQDNKKLTYLSMRELNKVDKNSNGRSIQITGSMELKKVDFRNLNKELISGIILIDNKEAKWIWDKKYLFD